MNKEMEPTPLSSKAIETFPEFCEQVRARLERGKHDYGDSSFTRPIAEVAGELQQECLDLAGWGFILYLRLLWIQQALATKEAPPADLPQP